MVAPELDQHLFELPLRVDGTQQDGRGDLPAREVADAVDLALALAGRGRAILAGTGPPWNGTAPLEHGPVAGRCRRERSGQRLPRAPCLRLERGEWGAGPAERQRQGACGSWSPHRPSFPLRLRARLRGRLLVRCRALGRQRARGTGVRHEARGQDSDHVAHEGSGEAVDGSPEAGRCEEDEEPSSGEGSSRGHGGILEEAGAAGPESPHTAIPSVPPGNGPTTPGCHLGAPPCACAHTRLQPGTAARTGEAAGRLTARPCSAYRRIGSLSTTSARRVLTER